MTISRSIRLGDKWPPTIQRSKFYFEQRHTRLDLRGPLSIAGDSHWGFFVTVITRSHKIKGGKLSKPVNRPVTVESKAWIGSRALLYNCIIGEGAVVAAGSVVCSCEVASNVVVAGNPAKVVARWDGGWKWLGDKWRVLA